MTISEESSPKTSVRHLDIVDRLRGQYHLPVNDGAGPLNGSTTFSREFPTPPIQKEAASVIEALKEALKQAQPLLAVLTKPDMSVSSHHLWAQCVEAEAKARAALAKAEGR